MDTTPADITDAILAFCRTIEPDESPFMVPVRSRKDALPDDCFFNVFDAVAEAGGAAQYGWIIWERPGIVLSAEFHSVWRTEQGLVDITPHDGEQTILFLPTAKQYEFRRVKPRRKALSNNGAVHALCRALDEVFDALEPYFVYPAQKGGAYFDVPPEAQRRLQALALRADEINSKVRRLERGSRRR